MKSREQLTASGDFPVSGYRADPEHCACWAALRDRCAEAARERGLVLAENMPGEKSVIYMRTAVTSDYVFGKRVECIAAEAEFVTLRLAVWAEPR